MKDEGARRLYVETQKEIYELSKRVFELELGASTFHQIEGRDYTTFLPSPKYLSLKNLVYLLMEHWGLDVVHTRAKTEVKLKCGAGGPFNPEEKRDKGYFESLRQCLACNTFLRGDETCECEEKDNG